MVQKCFGCSFSFNNHLSLESSIADEKIQVFLTIMTSLVMFKTTGSTSVAEELFLEILLGIYNNTVFLIIRLDLYYKNSFSWHDLSSG